MSNDEERAICVGYYALLTEVQGRRGMSRQVEYYFSDENLPGDGYLFDTVMKKNSREWVDLKVLCAFKKMKDMKVCEKLLKLSIEEFAKTLQISANGKQVRRRKPLPGNLSDVMNIAKRVLVFNNLSSTVSRAQIRLHLEANEVPLTDLRVIRIRNSEALIEFSSEKSCMNALHIMKDAGCDFVSIDNDPNPNQLFEYQEDLKENLAPSHEKSHLIKSPSDRKYSRNFLLNLKDDDKSLPCDKFKQTLTFNWETHLVEHRSPPSVPKSKKSAPTKHVGKKKTGKPQK